MGAANVLKAYHSWRHQLGSTSFTLLSYMAVRARDNDAAPWYGAGHDELAAIALGLPMPGGDDEKAKRVRNDSRRKVRRAMTELHQAGAVTTHRNAKPGKQATYLLWLDAPAPVDNRPRRRSESDLRTSGDVGQKVTYEQENVGHFSHKRRSESDLLRSKEEEELQERSSSKPNLRNGELWNAPRLRAVEDPWEEDERRRRLNGQASP